MRIRKSLFKTLALFLLSAALMLACKQAAAQPERNLLTNGQLMLQYLQQSKFDMDTAAQAIILYEKGYSVMSDGTITYKLERIVKILDQEAAGRFGTIELARGKDVFVTDIEATTYNLQGTQIVQQKLERADIFKDKLVKGITISKFNLPSLKAGSIIHYTYTINQAGYTIPDWTFQNSYPTLYSTFQINIPDYIIYSAIQRVQVPNREARKKKELDTCISCSFVDVYGKGQPTMSTWVRRNIPAFKEEPFMSSNANYVERIKIRVTAYIENGVVINIYKNWDEYCRKFYYKDNKFCGQAFDNNNFLKEKTEELTRDKNTDLDKAKAVFTYIRSNILLKESGAGATSDIKDVFVSRQGSLTGINLLLTAMLRKAGLNSAPVLLATRSEERLNDQYPDHQNINYLVSKVQIGTRGYFLDASAKHIPFGTLRPSCYNGYCRVITEKGDFAILYPDSLKNKTVVIAALTPGAEAGKLLLKTDYQFGVISSMNYRRNWIEDSNKVKTEFLKQLQASNPSAQLSDFRFVNTDRPDEPLQLHCENTVDISGNADRVYLNPYFDKFCAQNPFSANSRTYPIEMDYLNDMNYILNFTLPDNYTIDDYPKSAIIKLGNSNQLTMKNIMSYEEADKKFSIVSRFTTQTTVFPAANYTELRTFFDHIIEEQNKKIVLKKIP